MTVEKNRKDFFISVCWSFHLVTDGIISLELIKTENCLSVCVNAIYSVCTQIHASLRKLKNLSYAAVELSIRPKETILDRLLMKIWRILLFVF